MTTSIDMESVELKYETVARRIDHSLLGPTLTDAELIAGCELAARYEVASVCIKPYAVKLAGEVLKGTNVAVGTTIGFPHGGNATSVKLFEVDQACSDGAAELDMVINIGRAIAGDWKHVHEEIDLIVKRAHDRGAIVKVIFENCYLTDPQKIRLCEICGDARADYVKTSTGYGSGGAIHEDLKLMRRSSPSWVKLKAAGGIRDLAASLAVIELGCDRIGASRTAEILDALRDRLDPARGKILLAQETNAKGEHRIDPGGY